MTQYRILAPLLAGLVFACAPDDSTLLTDDTLLGVATVQPGFTFFPPWGAYAPSGNWAPDVLSSITVEIDETDPATLAVTRHLRTLNASSSPRLLASAPHEAYGVGWDIYNDTINTGAAYRIRILVGGTEVGRTDVPATVVPVLHSFQAQRREMWIKFRVEMLAVDSDGDGIYNWLDHCPNRNDPSNPTACMPALAWPDIALTPAPAALDVTFINLGEEGAGGYVVYCGTGGNSTSIWMTAGVDFDVAAAGSPITVRYATLAGHEYTCGAIAISASWNVRWSNRANATPLLGTWGVAIVPSPGYLDVHFENQGAIGAGWYEVNCVNVSGRSGIAVSGSDGLYSWAADYDPAEVGAPLVAHVPVSGFAGDQYECFVVAYDAQSKRSVSNWAVASPMMTGWTLSIAPSLEGVEAGSPGDVRMVATFTHDGSAGFEVFCNDTGSIATAQNYQPNASGSTGDTMQLELTLRENTEYLCVTFGYDADGVRHTSDPILYTVPSN